MKRGWLLVLSGLLGAVLGCGVLSSTPANTSEAPVPSGTEGRETEAVSAKWALWASGQTWLRGANLYQRRVFPELDGLQFMGPGPLGPPYTQEDFEALAAQGANWVDLSVPGLFTVQPPYQPDEAVIATVDSLIEMAARAGLYVVLSARTGPGRSEFSILRSGAGDWFPASYLVESVWHDAQARQAWAEMWRFTAERYHGYPVVIGYDLMVEPNANDILDEWDPQAFYARYAGTGYDWNAWYPQLVAAIREVDPDTPILVQGMGYSAVDWLPYLTPVDDPRTVYAVHQYMPFVYTHQAPEVHLSYPGKFDADGDGQADEVNRDWLMRYLQTLADFRQQVGAPVAVNELGLVRWAPHAAEFMNDQLAVLEGLGVNYAVWVWHAAWPPLAEGDHAFTFRFGPDPDHRKDVPNALWETYRRYWQRNRVFYSAPGP